MKKFKIGEKVIALTNPLSDMSQRRVKGNIYTVLAISYCYNCGRQAINIDPTPITAEFTRCNCGARQSTHGLWWTNSKYFSKVDKDSLQEAIDEENYELAALIRDALE